MKTERPEKPARSGRSDRGDKPERPARSEKISKPVRKSEPKSTGRSDRGEKPERSARPERAGKPERNFEPKRAGRSDRGDKPERPARPERAGKPERSFEPKRAGRPVRDEKPERPARPERAGKTEKFERAGKPERYERSERPERAGRPEKSIRLNQSSLPERTTKPKRVVTRGEKNDNPDLIRLNKYIANSGICSRREADRLIEAGAVSVNGEIVTELGIKVGPGDKIQYGDQTINREKPRYVLLNKPKGYITTVDDPEKRKTVMALVAGACKERIYPVGRLDRNTTGLLLFTNDGNIAKKLTHPRYGIRKIYHVELDKNLARTDFVKISEGFKLEDEVVKVDSIEYIGDGKDKKQIGIELHSGQNRIVRRIFEFFEYKVLRLDRVYYAGLTKKNLPRGHWRLLDEQEINLLKMISSKP
ncbi:MAG: pseudouridine synthase [Bacteroidetes bacterium]|nr:pseudouridine synthase [Bacteroidota bacterium]